MRSMKILARPNVARLSRLVMGLVLVDRIGVLAEWFKQLNESKTAMVLEAFQREAYSSRLALLQEQKWK